MPQTQPAVELYQIKVDGAKEDEASLREWARGATGEWYYQETVNKEPSGWNLAAYSPPEKANLVDLPKDKLVHDVRIPLEETAAKVRAPGEPPETETAALKDPRQAEYDQRSEERRRAAHDSELARQQELAKLSERKVAAMEVPAEPDQVSNAELAREVKEQGVPPPLNEKETPTSVTESKKK